MRFEKTGALERRLAGSGFAELAKLDSFTIDDEHFGRFLGHVAGQHPAISEEEQRAEAAFRVLTVGAPRAGAPESSSYYPQFVATLNDALGRHATSLDQHGERMRAILEEARGRLDSIAGSADRIEAAAAGNRESLGSHLSWLRTEIKREDQERAAEADALREAIRDAWQRAERKARRRHRTLMALLIAALLALLALAGLPARLHAQEPALPGAALPTQRIKTQDSPRAKVQTSRKEAAGEAPRPDFSVSDAWRARIRNLQYEQDRQLIRLQNLELEEQKTGEKIRDQQRTIEESIEQLAAERHVDTSKFVFDLDALSWKSKEK